jgi:CRISPR/Cas system-associated exonuclease Cas4 (RecB family)
MHREKPIPVTELAEFVYCKRAWWLNRVLKHSPNREALQAQAEGDAWHAAQASGMARSNTPFRIAYALLLIAALLLILLLIGIRR